MNYQLDQVVRYKGTEHKIVGVLVDGLGNVSKIMLDIDGKISIINCNEIK